ncbi:MAG: glycosyltransferase [Acidimicrobiales bacterium]
MRFLFTCVPGFGHFHPMVPLARALEAAEHEVAFATAERFCRRVVEPAGFTAFAAGMSPPDAYEQTQELAGATEDDAWTFGAMMFARVAGPAKVGDLVQVLGSWPADAVIHDMTDFAGPVAAAVGGLPWAGHTFGSLPPQQLWDAAATLIEPTWQAWGVEPDRGGGMFRSLYLDICPASLQAPLAGRAVGRPLRPVAIDEPGARLPAWADELGPGPTIYVTLGTVVNHSPGVFETVLEGLAALPGHIVVTLGPDRDPAELGPRPANVHVEAYLPHSVLLPRCDLVVCHGGSGTTLAALAAGLPVLVLPQDANQFWNAERIASLGAGTQLRPSELTAEAVQAAASGLLDDPSHRRHAQALAAEIAAMPGPDDVVATVEDLVHRHRRHR